MKTLILFLLFSASAVAGEIFYPVTQSAMIFTNVTFNSNVTAFVTFTNVQMSTFSKLHTFQIFASTTGTNQITAYLDRTIDGTNWIPCSTNILSTNGIAEFITTGKWAQHRWRITALSTNANIIANYIAE